jgi:hypothetical protein
VGWYQRNAAQKALTHIGRVCQLSIQQMQFIKRNLKHVSARTQCMIIVRLAGIHKQQQRGPSACSQMLFGDLQPTKQNSEYILELWKTVPV